MKNDVERERRFLDISREYKDVVAKVCYLYSSPTSPFDDLFQEVLINIWQGLDSFRGDSKMSTWIYRTAINTCISWHRRNGRHGGSDTLRLDDLNIDPRDSAEGEQRLERYRELQRLISLLNPLEKALITLWLDEKPYNEIGLIMGISPGNVAVRIHRIKDKLAQLAQD